VSAVGAKLQSAERVMASMCHNRPWATATRSATSVDT